jgi:glutaredoxin
MKKLIVLYGDNCGYCKKAKMLIRRVLEKNPHLGTVSIQYVQDNSESASLFVHTLVPAFFCNGELVFEGNPDINTVYSIIENCYKS